MKSGKMENLLKVVSSKKAGCVRQQTILWAKLLDENSSWTNLNDKIPYVDPRPHVWQVFESKQNGNSKNLQCHSSNPRFCASDCEWWRGESPHFSFTLILSLQCETKAERHKKYCWTNEHKNHCPSTDGEDNNYCPTHEHKNHCPTYMNTKTADEEEKIIAQLMNRAISILCRQILWMPMIVLSRGAARSVIRPKYFLLCSHLHWHNFPQWDIS